jgi:hypothetical protein
MQYVNEMLGKSQFRNVTSVCTYGYAIHSLTWRWWWWLRTNIHIRLIKAGVKGFYLVSLLISVE